ncbi:Dyp-type peroxidase, partial [Obba rivulosa]
MSLSSDYHPDQFKHVHTRRIRPLLPATLKAQPDIVDGPVLDADQLDDIRKNVQGDVFMLFPKIAENFLFFTIRDVAQFKTDLKAYIPSSSLDTTDKLTQISSAKQRGDRIPLTQTQIAFSRAGLDVLGCTGKTQDTRFDTRPMLSDMEALGDGGPWYTPFKEGNLHGVFSVAASDHDQCAIAMEGLEQNFRTSIFTNDKMILEGHARPGVFKGREHFGYKDGVSQPALRGLVHPHRGQLQVDPGVIIMGYPGDPVFDRPEKMQRPAWTKNGSLMVFRQLEQDVVEFDAYIKKRGKDWPKYVQGVDVQPPLSDEEGTELVGAQMIGRWKSGAPIATCPYRDDPKIAADKDEVNNFDYCVAGFSEPSNRFCPFTAHTRKTAPRNLYPYVDSDYLESAVVVRGGIPYGPEVTQKERDAGSSLKDGACERGLLFICYQSCLENGFIRQTLGFAGNDYFPIVSLTPQKHGQDPILGGPPPPPASVDITGKIDVPIKGEVTLRLRNKAGDLVDVEGFTKLTDIAANNDPQQFFVTSRGGEYFFVPSVSFIKQLAHAKSPILAPHDLDVVILQDATDGNQPYIDAVRSNIPKIFDAIATDPKLQKSTLDVRLGLIAFRDYKPLDYTMLTQVYDLTLDPAVLSQQLNDLSAKGGCDGPDGQTAALAEAVKMDWRKDT